MSEKLNFLFIITDQQKKDHLSCYNENMVLETSNIDKFAQEGIKFTNFYCNNPICMPNRSTIFTDQEWLNLIAFVHVLLQVPISIQRF